MPRPTIVTAMTACWLAAVCAWASDATPGLSAKLHPWGLFNPGAWKTVRVVTETLDDRGHVSSISTTDTKTTLVDLDNEGITLEIQACMDVAGKRFEAEPQTVKQGFHGELLGERLVLKPPLGGQVTIEGQKIPCRVQQLETITSGGKTVTTLHYSIVLAPYVLKRESATFDAEGRELGQTHVDVVARNMPVQVHDEQKSGIYVKTVQTKSDGGSVTTLATVLPEVPGGVVHSSTKELDKNGRLVRRSTLELIDYNEDPDKDRSGMFGRKRSSRHRNKPSSYYSP